MKCSRCKSDQVALSENFGVFDFHVGVNRGQVETNDFLFLGIVRAALCKSCMRELHQQSTKIDGELKIWKIILIGAILFGAAIVGAIIKQPAIAGFCGIAGIAAVVSQFAARNKQIKKNKQLMQAYQTAEDAGFKDVSMEQFIDLNKLENVDTAVILNYRKIKSAEDDGKTPEEIAAEEATVAPFSEKFNDRARVFVPVKDLDAAYQELMEKPMDDLIMQVYNLKTAVPLED